LWPACAGTADREDTAARGPPAAAPTQDQLVLELQYVDTDEFLMAL